MKARMMVAVWSVAMSGLAAQIYSVPEGERLDPSYAVMVDGATSAATISGIIADEAAIGMVNQKTTAVRVIPVAGKRVGQTVEFGGLLGHAPIMKVSKFSCEKFVARKGRIPAPIHSFKN